MSEKRFVFATNEKWFLFDNETEDYMDMEDCKDKLNEQQDIIFKLQDLCGESDGENAKLRIENKMLEKEVKLLKPTNLEQYEQIQKLQEENEQLKNQNIEYEEVQCRIMNYIIDKGLGSEFAKFLRENM